MKGIRKENTVKATTLSKEEMIEVVGGRAVNGFISGDFSSRISFFCTFIRNDNKISEQMIIFGNKTTSWGTEI